MEALISPSFEYLGLDEDPILGLFFFELEENLDPVHRANQSTNRPSSAGMASLITQNGLFVTCAHVLLALGARPGEEVTLFGASNAVTVELKARVCQEGWLGPELNEQGQRQPSLFWERLYDGRPDVFKEDIAFLRIVWGSVRWHPRSGQSMTAELGAAERHLLSYARVLPFSAPGYRTAGIPLKAWRVNWIWGGPDCQAGDAVFRSVDTGAHNAVRVSSKVLGPGFSGSPLWDAHRRTMVAIVRRGLLAMKADELVLATDARALLHHPDAFLVPDRRSMALEHRLLDALNSGFSGAYVDMAGPTRDLNYIPPEIALYTSTDPLQPVQERASAIEYIISHLGTIPGLVVRAPAGTGKSALLWRLAIQLLKVPTNADGRRVLPLLLSAADLLNHKLDLSTYLESQWLVVRPLDCEKDLVVDVLSDNGISLVLLVDGLDEIPSAQQANLLARLTTGVRAGARRRPASRDDAVDSLVLSAIVASRPIDVLKNPIGLQQRNLQVVDLCSFDSTRIEHFCALVFPEEVVRKNFKAALKHLRWASSGVPPLQLRMACALFSWEGELPARGLDLTSEYVKHWIERSTKDFLERQAQKPPMRNEVLDLYIPSIKEILAFAASSTLQLDRTELSAEGFHEALQAWVKSGKADNWAGNAGSLREFLFQDLPQVSAIISIRNASPGQEDKEQSLVWAHRTFVEYLSAEHLSRQSGEDASALMTHFDALLKSGEHGQALSLLGVIDRDRSVDLVSTILKNCMLSRNAVAGSRPQLFVIRALAAGIDAKGRTRSEQIGALIRFLVSDLRETQLCLHFFQTEDLPEAKEILAFPELKQDIFLGMKQRFRYRLMRATRSRPAVVLQREAMIIELAGLWPDFIDLGLRAPERAETLEGASLEGQAGHAGVATIKVRRPNGADQVLTLPSDQFIDTLVAMARRTSPSIAAAELVELTINMQSRDMIECIGPFSPTEPGLDGVVQA